VTPRRADSEAVPELTLPVFALRDENGRLLRSEDLGGMVVALTFLDTMCTEACPIIAGRIANTWRLLTPSERSRATAVVSTDPRDDTRANVRAFLARHRARKRSAISSGLFPSWARCGVAFRSCPRSSPARRTSTPLLSGSRAGPCLARDAARCRGLLTAQPRARHPRRPQYENTMSVSACGVPRHAARLRGAAPPPPPHGTA